ncbi:MAG: alpha/beta fold hydrolase [Actinobacteria bacterium]|nr:alpha/beta fold hydrolase [Actinomycetota bacterium]
MTLAITKFSSGDTDDTAKHIVLFLHGYGADERDLPELMSYLPDLPWYSPRAPIDLGGAYSWYKAEDLLKPTVVDVAESTAALLAWIDEYIPQETKLILIGFSQGGLMATQLLRTRPERISGTVILSGFMAVGELPTDSELEQTKPKVIYCRGSEDQRITKEAIATLNTWLQTKTRAMTKTYAGLGHSVDERVMRDVAQYITSQLS